jgi:membrane protein DedA with SNARE-associated domain
MHSLPVLLGKYGLAVVFGNVLLQQIGVPIPAEPTLVVAGSMTVGGPLSPAMLVAVIMAAALLADSMWFFLGRRYEAGMLRLFARLSRSASHPSRGRDAFARWGLKSLLGAKFLPGVSQLLVPIAGATGVRYRSFILYDVAGTLIWSSLPVGGGILFHQQIDAVLAALSRIGMWVGLAALVLATGILVSRRISVRNVDGAAENR